MGNPFYSGKVCPGATLVDEPIGRFDPTLGPIVGLYIPQEEPDTVVFPEGITCRFEKCNLDNCAKPAGCTTDEGDPGGTTNKRILPFPTDEPNKTRDWIVDASNQPVSPIDGEEPSDPATIPAEYVMEFTTTLAEYRADFGGEPDA